MTDNSALLNAYSAFFEALTAEDLQRFDSLFNTRVHFKDPFNDVRGIAAVKQVFTHMFRQCDNPRFSVLHQCGVGDQGYLHWRFDFTPKGGSQEQSLEGVSRVTFDAEGRVVEHIDYWDPAEQLYSKVPLLGRILGLIRRRLSAEGG